MITIWKFHLYQLTDGAIFKRNFVKGAAKIETVSETAPDKNVMSSEMDQPRLDLSSSVSLCQKEENSRGKEVVRSGVLGSCVCRLIT